jgi:hypothetical protein
MTTTASTTNWYGGLADIAGGRGALSGDGQQPTAGVAPTQGPMHTRADLIDAAVKLYLKSAL